MCQLLAGLLLLLLLLLLLRLYLLRLLLLLLPLALLRRLHSRQMSWQAAAAERRFFSIAVSVGDVSEAVLLKEGYARMCE